MVVHRIPALISLILLLGIALVAPSAQAVPHVISSGTQDWLTKARTSRADMLVIGDSIVNYQGEGWDAGFIQAAADRWGLAGTGLLTGKNREGEDYSASHSSVAGWKNSLSSVPSDKRGLVWRGDPATAGSVPTRDYILHIDGDNDIGLPANGIYDFYLYSTAPTGDMIGNRRVGEGGYVSLRTVNPWVQDVVPGGIHRTVYRFRRSSISPDLDTEFRMLNATNNTFLYTRALWRDAVSGVTVTSWGYPGRSVRDFYTDQYVGPMSSDGRAGFLDALVSGGSGKLNVVIGEGFNDRNEDQTSLGGKTDADSPAAFLDNMRHLIGQIATDWLAAGNRKEDLSFTLLGMYEPGDPSELRAYAEILRQLALSDDRISFIDLYEITPSYDDAAALGYFADSTHLTREGALEYSRRALAAMEGDALALAQPFPLAGSLEGFDASANPSGAAPEPAMAGAVLLLGMTMLLRRR